MSKRSREVIPPVGGDPDNPGIEPAKPKKWDESGIQTPDLQNFYPSYSPSYHDYQPSDLRDYRYPSPQHTDNRPKGSPRDRDWGSKGHDLRDQRYLERVLEPIMEQVERNLAQERIAGEKRGQRGNDLKYGLDLYDLANFMNQYDDTELNEYE